MKPKAKAWHFQSEPELKKHLEHIPFKCAGICVL
jgi:hypothetical protein